MQFDQLHLSPLISQAVKNKGYTQPTPIQQKAIPIILSGKDLIGKAPTGTGKTAAFMLPALHKIAESENRQKPQILVLSPTRELATQITNVIYTYGKEIHVKPITILGGMPYREQQRKLSRPGDVIVATPGRLIDYLERGDVDLSQISMLILDEADRMLDMGFIEDVEFIASKTPKKRQTLLFTATMDKRLLSLSQNILRSPQMVEVKNDNVTLDNISQRIHFANDNNHKFKLLQHLLGAENIFKAIIFSATKRNADKLTRDLSQTGYRVAALHGDLNQRKRNKVIAEFREGKVQYLIATDVAARGIDINDITHVINYDLPKFAEDYVHRIGRTGRAGRDGIAISFVLASDHNTLKKIERFTVQTIPRTTIKGLEPHTQPKNQDSHKNYGHKKNPNRSFSPSKKPKFSRHSNFEKNSEKDFNFKDRNFGNKPKNKNQKNFGRNFNKPFERFEKSGNSSNFGKKERNFSPTKKPKFGRNQNSEKNFEGNFERNFRDKPKKSFGRDFNKSFERSERPERSGNSSHFGKKERNFSHHSEKRSFGDKPKKNFGGNSERNFGDKPKKNFGRDFKKPFEKFEKSGNSSFKKPFKKSFKSFKKPKS